MNSQSDVTFRHTTITFRSPRSVILLQPFQLAGVLSLTAVAIVFTFWPETLDHTGISFEKRGIIHHIWHYSLLAACVMTLVGMFDTSRRRLRLELSGIVVLCGVMGMNLTAIIADALQNNSTDVTGLGAGLRVGFTLGLAIRAYIIATEPLVNLTPGDV